MSVFRQRMGEMNNKNIKSESKSTILKLSTMKVILVIKLCTYESLWIRLLLRDVL